METRGKKWEEPSSGLTKWLGWVAALRDSTRRLTLGSSWGRCQFLAPKALGTGAVMKAGQLGRAWTSHPFCLASFMLLSYLKCTCHCLLPPHLQPSANAASSRKPLLEHITASSWLLPLCTWVSFPAFNFILILHYFLSSLRSLDQHQASPFSKLWIPPYHKCQLGSHL